MGCLVVFKISEVDLQVGCNKKAQKHLIEFLLTYSEYDLRSLAELLEVSPLFLLRVIKGEIYLNDTNSHKLWDWFLMFISNE
jgi:uncharacterized membrane protein YciS (DUF1049 family)